MNKRLNITLPEQTVQLIGRVVGKTRRSGLIDRAVRCGHRAAVPHPAAAEREPLRTTCFERYSLRVPFEKIWVEQCQATRAIKRRFGAKSALDYLIGEKLVTFAEVAEVQPEFASELPKFLAAVWRVFNEYEIAGYVATRKPGARRSLRRLLYLR